MWNPGRTDSPGRKPVVTPAGGGAEPGSRYARPPRPGAPEHATQRRGNLSRRTAIEVGPALGYSRAHSRGPPPALGAGETGVCDQQDPVSVGLRILRHGPPRLRGRPTISPPNA